MPGHRSQLHLTASEWAILYGGKKPDNENAKFKRLPLGFCCLTLQPAKEPHCDAEGHVFDYQAITNYLKKFKVNPVTGKSLKIKTLTKLNFYKNTDGEVYCPISLRIFTPCSYVVAIKTTGNVFSYNTVDKFNIKPQYWHDLISYDKFERSDILVLQNPNNIDKFNFNNFYHLNCKQNKIQNGRSLLNNVSYETKEILKNLEEVYKSEDAEVVEKPVADKINAAHYSTGEVGASFTSTILEPETKHQFAILKEDIVRYERVKKSGYLRLNTNMGVLNFELYCHLTPKTCENFIKHCQNSYYNDTILYRSIRHFIIQGGDPAGGKSFWDKPFSLEINKTLSHSDRGVLGMVSTDKKTPGSQFYITYRSCKHLDGKHTIFGHLVGGMETLAKMESIEVDNMDKPIEDIKIMSVDIFKDPFQEADELLAKERAKLKEEELVIIDNRKKQYKEYRSGVGKYIDFDRVHKGIDDVPCSDTKKLKKTV